MQETIFLYAQRHLIGVDVVSFFRKDIFTPTHSASCKGALYDLQQLFDRFLKKRFRNKCERFDPHLVRSDIKMTKLFMGVS